MQSDKEVIFGSFQVITVVMLTAYFHCAQNSPENTFDKETHNTSGTQGVFPSPWTPGQVCPPAIPGSSAIPGVWGLRKAGLPRETFSSLLFSSPPSCENPYEVGEGKNGRQEMGLVLRPHVALTFIRLPVRWVGKVTGLQGSLMRVAGVQETNPKEISQEARSTLPWGWAGTWPYGTDDCLAQALTSHKYLNKLFWVAKLPRLSGEAGRKGGVIKCKESLLNISCSVYFQGEIAGNYFTVPAPPFHIPVPQTQLLLKELRSISTVPSLSQTPRYTREQRCLKN